MIDIGYYRISFLIGVGIAGLCLAVFMQSKIFEVAQWYYRLPVLTGVCSGFLVAFMVDQGSMRFREGTVSIVLFSLLIFLSCALAGCFANVLINGFLLANGSGEFLLDVFKSFLLRPLAWICSAGIPMTAIIALLFRWATR